MYSSSPDRFYFYTKSKLDISHGCKHRQLKLVKIRTESLLRLRNMSNFNCSSRQHFAGTENNWGLRCRPEVTSCSNVTFHQQGKLETQQRRSSSKFLNCSARLFITIETFWEYLSGEKVDTFFATMIKVMTRPQIFDKQRKLFMFIILSSRS